MSHPLLSIIIPAHNEENRLPGTLEQIFDFLKHQAYDSEVWIVENGSTDRTFAVAQQFAGQYPTLRVIRERERGKGLAVRRGMLEAAGAYRFMADADLSMPAGAISKFLPPALKGFDIAIASREVRGSVRYNEPPYRHLGGRAINWIIRLLILPGLQDTQCGFKCFRAEVARDLFQHQTMPGWSFDIEVLAIARRRGYPITEVPIDWYYRPESKVNAVRDALRMIRDIFRIRANARRGLYDAH